MTEPPSATPQAIGTPSARTDRLTLAGVAALAAAWTGWGFDAFDALLFSYIYKPALASLHHGGEPARYLGLLTSLFLIGWATGGILFGRITDRIGRTRTLLLTMLLYSVSTAACAFSTNLATLVVLRVAASLGVGGEWAAGASLVSEALPERLRLWGGAILYTSAPAGLFLAGAIASTVLGHYAGHPDLGWRMCFLAGLIPAAGAFLIRLGVREPDRFKAATEGRAERGRVRDLFAPALRRRTLAALGLATVALVTWWGCTTFLRGVLDEWGGGSLVARGNTWFNVGGVVGTLLTVPIAARLGRRPMYGLYFAGAMATMLYLFGLPHTTTTRLACLFLCGVTVFGVFGSFTYYLPELFPTRLRGTGSGFCYNTGRYLASTGPLFTGSLVHAIGYSQAIFYVGFFYLVGFAVLPFARETRGRPLEE